MDTRLNLYPDKMIAQCINAISLLSDANESLTSLKFEINEFVNDSYIQSVSFDELKKQCQNYVTVIDAMISCNEADIADFGILKSVLDGVHEDLIGEKIDYWEKYYQALISKYNSLLDSGVHSQLQAYFGTLLSTYQELYNMWYAKELLYYEVDSKTSSLFAKSYGRQAISNMLAVLKTSFTLNTGYNANVVAAKRAEMEKATTESVHMEPEVKVVWDALIQSGKTSEAAKIIISDLKTNNVDYFDRIKHIISSAGYDVAEKAVEISEVNYLNWLNKANKLGQYYVENVDTYCKKHIGDPGYGSTAAGRKAYPVLTGTLDGVFDNKIIQDDCSSYVYYSLVYSGFMDYTDSPSESKGYLPNSGYAVVNKLKDQGFKWYSSADLSADEIRKGDILVRDGHVEIFERFDQNGTEWAYTWGAVYEIEPTDKALNINNIWSRYSGVWRYEGSL